MTKRGGALDVKKGLACVFAAAGTVLLVLATLVACVEGVAFRREFYQKEYDKLDSAAYVGVDRETLDEATNTLLEYLEGKRDSLDLAVEIDGERQEYYNDKEKQHMVDVAVLNQNAVAFMSAAYPIGGALVLAAWLLKRNTRLVVRTCFFSIIGTLVAFGVLAAWAGVDFTSFWINFHHVFFSNDLWVLDPATDRMIRMFEQTLFFDMVTQILLWFIGIIVAAVVVTGIWGKRCKSR
ncbi:TIGR01906 family membrane protein [Christensenellaceae bacterium OttesenSCG-928-K19]|nr:TIGR01906 family membrane protein [Christensenellaceae bacterium OttesenSCG-928-K19]